MANEDAERKRYADKIAREWADRGKLVEGGWRSFRQVMMKDLDFDTAETREQALRTLYYLACDHLFSCMIGPILDPGHEETPGDLRRFALIQQELATWRVQFLAPHKPGRA